jgi:hypothetical protein
MTVELIAQTELTKITKKTVAIVKFGYISSDDGTKPACYYQVTIDPQKVSPCGKFIRFGLCNGDEINGWQKADVITIVSILAEWPDDETEPLIILSPLCEIEMPMLVTE